MDGHIGKAQGYSARQDVNNVLPGAATPALTAAQRHSSSSPVTLSYDDRQTAAPLQLQQRTKSKLQPNFVSASGEPEPSACPSSCCSSLSREQCSGSLSAFHYHVRYITRAVPGVCRNVLLGLQEKIGQHGFARHES